MTGEKNCISQKKKGRKINRKEKAAQLKPENQRTTPDQIKIDKTEFSKHETLIFELDPLKTFQHRIEHYSGQKQQIMIDEEFLLDDGDDPEKVLEEMKKKQKRLSEIENEEKKLSDNIKKADKTSTIKPNEESEAFK